jgi:hypothetical protein
MEILARALEFEANKSSFKTRNEKIIASRQAKELILSINEIYKENRDPNLMDIMKRITVIKQKIEKRLKMKIVV